MVYVEGGHKGQSFQKSSLEKRIRGQGEGGFKKEKSKLITRIHCHVGSKGQIKLSIKKSGWFRREIKGSSSICPSGEQKDNGDPSGRKETSKKGVTKDRILNRASTKNGPFLEVETQFKEEKKKKRGGTSREEIKGADVGLKTENCAQCVSRFQEETRGEEGAQSKGESYGRQYPFSGSGLAVIGHIIFSKPTLLLMEGIIGRGADGKRGGTLNF